MLSGAVSGVDDRHARDRRGALGGAHLLVPDHNHVRVAVQDADRVLQCFALGDGGKLRGVFGGDDVPAQPMHGGLKRETGARRGLVKERGHDAVVIVGDAAPRYHLFHFLGGFEDLEHRGNIKLLRFDDVVQAHFAPPRIRVECALDALISRQPGWVAGEDTARAPLRSIRPAREASASPDRAHWVILSNNLSVDSPGFEALLGLRMWRRTFRRWVELLIVEGREHAAGQISRPVGLHLGSFWVRFWNDLVILQDILGSFLEFRCSAGGFPCRDSGS